MSLLKPLWTATWKIALFLILWGVLYAPAVLLLDLGTQPAGGPIAPETRLYLEVFGVAAVVVAAWILLRFVDQRTLVSLGFSPGGAVRDLGIGLVFGAILTAIAVAILWFPGWVDMVPISAFSWRVLGLLGAAMLFNSVTQEVLMRGYVLQTIEAEFNVTVALLASSAIFVLLHISALVEGGFMPALNLFAAGLLLGLAYTTTRNLWLPMGLHFSWNFVQGPVLGIAVSGKELGGGWKVLDLEGPTIFTGGSFGLEAGLAATLATVLGIIVLITAHRKKN